MLASAAEQGTTKHGKRHSLGSYLLHCFQESEHCYWEDTPVYRVSDVVEREGAKKWIVSRTGMWSCENLLT
jgi:Zn-finger protein